MREVRGPGAGGLTEGVVELLDGQGEAAVGALDAEEDHGDVLGGAAGGGASRGGAVVCVALVHGQLVVLPAGELLSLQNPAVKHLPQGEMNNRGLIFFFLFFSF